MLTASELLAGYAQGIFPMAPSANTETLHWFSPDPRGVLPIGSIHASRSLRRELRKGGWTARHAPDLDAVVRTCAARDDTWINTSLRHLYRDLYDAGHAHALEVFKGGKLAGGIFGVKLGAAYFGESMFSTQTSGSRMALLWMDWLLKTTGYTLFDTQYLTPHLESMGGTEIPRAIYRRLLQGALSENPADLYATALPDAQLLLQEITQTS